MRWLLLIIILVSCGCYNQRKAASQFAKAAIFDQKLPADYCANTFPPKTVTVRDTLTKTDTIQQPGTVHTDTIRIGDTVRINTVTVLPGKVITNTIRITDTIIRESTQSQARIRSLEIDNSRLTAVIGPLTLEKDSWEKKAKTRFWIILALGAVIGVGVYLKIAGIFKK